MVHMKSVLVLLKQSTMKISQQIISVRSNVITVISPVQLSLLRLVLINCLCYQCR